jgi:CheY-like chemotaxis protein
MEQNRSIPLIALSSLCDKIDKNEFNHAFKTYLIKPVKELKLKRIIMDTISSKNFRVNVYENSFNKIQQITRNFNNLNILIVEDVYINQKVVVNFLKKIG